LDSCSRSVHWQAKRGLSINVRAENFHHHVGVAEFAKTELAIKAVSVASRQTESAQSLQRRVAHHTFHQPLSQSFAAVFFKDINVAEIREGSGVRDDSRETDLRFSVKHGEA